jgi:hypothetical protein
VALDCVATKEFARISVVNYEGCILFDKHIQKSDYSRFAEIKHEIKSELTTMLTKKIVVGFALSEHLHAMDLQTLDITAHDLSVHSTYQDKLNQALDRKPANFEHRKALGPSCPVEDARAALAIFCTFEDNTNTRHILQN